MKFYVCKKDEEVAKEDRKLDCDHIVIKGDIFYVLYDHEQPVMEVCKNCVILDKEE